MCSGLDIRGRRGASRFLDVSGRFGKRLDPATPVLLDEGGQDGLHRKRRLLLGLGLTVTLRFGAALPATASAQSTLTGENLIGSSQGNVFSCAPSYSVSGTATGPYAGTFSESGSWDQAFNFAATFTIASGTTTITGSKGPGSCQAVPGGHRAPGRPERVRPVYGDDQHSERQLPR